MTSADRDPGEHGPAELAEIVVAFESAWQAALRGGVPPELESQLTKVDSSQRAKLRSSLLSIDQRFRALSSRAAPDQQEKIAPTLNLAVKAGDADQQDEIAQAEPAETLALASASTEDLRQAPDPESTGEYHPGRQTSESELEATQAAVSAPASDDRWPEIPGYEIRSVLGRGGMGVVYRARQTGLKRVVALKMILAGGHASPEMLARFQAEAEAVAHLQHPNIVQVYDVGKHDGLPFFSLEFVDGQSLLEEIDGKPMKPDRAAELVELTARAMHYAHQHGVVHRDLKPANILLTQEGQPKVSDFGLVKRLESDSSQTRTGTIMGTPSYMAPEQGAGAKNVGPLADVYALGAILYCTLTGRPPFVGATAFETLVQALNDDPLPPTRLQPKTPVDLETICLKCLQKEASKRYPSAEELAEDLRRFRAGEPITARPVSRWERGWRWCLRNPRLASVSAAAAALLLMLAVGGPVAALLINRQRNEAIVAKQSAEAAQIRAELNEAEAERNAEIAEEQRLLAEDSLRTVVYKVHDRLQDERGENELRRELLQLAIAGLERVLQRDEGYRGRDHLTASAYRKLGSLCLEVGETDGAMRNYQKSLDIVLRLVQQGRMGDPDKTLANLYFDLGNALLAFGEASQAGEQFQLALQHWQRVREEQPEDRKSLDRLAKTYGRLAAVAAAQHDTETQRDFTFRGLEIRKQWLEKDPDNVDARAEYAGAMKSLASLSLNLGDPHSAQQQAQLALDILHELTVLQPENDAYRANAAMQLWAKGYYQLICEQYLEAQDTLLRAVDLMSAARDRDQESALLREQSGEAHYYAGIACVAVGERENGQHHHQQALQIREKLLAKASKSSKRRCRVMLSLTRCGDHDRAVQEASELRAAHSKSAFVLINCACAEALIAATILGDSQQNELPPDERAEYEARRSQALADIAQVLDSGFQAFFALRTDPDTDGLRKLAGYLEMLDRAEAGNEQ